MTKNARTDTTTGLRFYNWQGADLISVTSVRKLLGMPHNLHNWTLSKVVGRAVDDYATLGQMLTREPRPRERVTEKNRIEEAKKWLRSAATEERDAAGARGTSVHDAIDFGLAPTDEAVTNEMRPFLYQWYDFVKSTGAITLASEVQVFSPSRGYAGTIDRIVKIDNDFVMIDLKTSKGVYLDHAIQVIAYAMGDFIGEDDVVNEPLTKVLHSVNKVALLHLAPNGWELVEVAARTDLFAAFEGSLLFARFLHNHHEVIDDLIVSTRKGATHTTESRGN